MKFLFVLLVLGLAIALLSGEVVEPVQNVDAATATNEVLSLEQIAKLPIKKLRGMLEKKGLDCKGCSEKSEYVTKVHDSQELPDVEAAPVPEEPYQQPPIDQDKMDELMAKLKMNGFGNSRMFSADDLKNMSPDELGERLNTGKSRRGSKAKGKGKKPSKGDEKSKNTKPKEEKKFEARREEDGGQTIEL